jgi:type IV pilus assembly protein PilB
MVLVTGPTGSGKTVTLYSALNILNTEDRNISTVEDPVEINMPGINQVNQNPRTGMTFAAALRAFLRQDPDVIMVGEVRDLETAEIAIKAAQTGHMVLSTLHTNDAPQTITRLMNMGVAPFNITSSIALVIAQRLVRKLCEYCKKPADLPEAALLKVGFKKENFKDLKLFEPVGCSHCNEGYKGRIGIFEMIPITEPIARIILEGGNSMQISEEARDEGFPDLRTAGLVKVSQGVTSVAEVYRATAE